MAHRKSKVQTKWNSNFAYTIGVIATDGNLSPDQRHVVITSKDLEMISNCAIGLKIEMKYSKKARGGEHDKKYFDSLMENLSKNDLSLDRYILQDGNLFEISEEDGTKHSVTNLKEMIEFLRKNGRKGIEIQRYKGLGEMNADQLWETTMDPAKRTLIQVMLPDAIAADHMFSMLMGEEVQPRKEFIELHALSVKNLDI